MYHFLDSSTFLFIHSVDMLVIVANKSVPTLIKHNDIENMNRLAIHSDIDSITIYISYSFSFI